MSRQTEWRCPYCDALNDWQDLECQVCGDGRRDMVHSREEDNLKTETRAEWKEAEAAWENSQRDQGQYSQTDAKASERGGGAYQREPSSFGKAAPDEKTAAAASAGTKKTETSSKKKYAALKWIAAIAMVVLAVCAYKAFGQLRQVATIAKEMDVSLLENSPLAATEAEAIAWAKEQGYEIEQKEPGELFHTVSYYINPGETVWTACLPKGVPVTLAGEEPRLESLEYFVRNDGPNMDMLYEKVSGKLLENGWKQIMGESGKSQWELLGQMLKKEKDKEQLSLWQDSRGNYYFLWKTGEPPEEYGTRIITFGEGAKSGLGIVKIGGGSAEGKQEAALAAQNIDYQALAGEKPADGETELEKLWLADGISVVPDLISGVEGAVGKDMACRALSAFGTMSDFYEYFVETEQNEIFIQVSKRGVVTLGLRHREGDGQQEP